MDPIHYWFILCLGIPLLLLVGMGLMNINDTYFIFRSVVVRWRAGIKTGDTYYYPLSVKFGPKIGWEPIKGKPIVINQTGCDVAELMPLESAIPLVQFGGCWLDQKAANLAQVGAQAAIFVTDGDEKGFPGMDSSLNVSIPVYVIKSSTFDILKWSNELIVERVPDMPSISTDVAGIFGIIVVGAGLVLGTLFCVGVLLDKLKTWNEKRKYNAAKKHKYERIPLDEMA